MRVGVRHCEERSDAAIQENNPLSYGLSPGLRRLLAMTTFTLYVRSRYFETKQICGKN